MVPVQVYTDLCVIEEWAVGLGEGHLRSPSALLATF